MNEEKKESLKEERAKLTKNFQFLRANVLGLDQREFAALIGFSQGVVSRMETGKRLPDSETLLMLHREGVSLNFLAEGEGEFFRIEDKNAFETQGQRLRKVRLEHQVEQAAFADLMGVSLPEMVRIERDLLIPKEKEVIVICHEFNIDYDWIKKGGEPGPVYKEGKGNVPSSELEFFKNKVFELEKKTDANKERIFWLEKQNKALIQQVQTKTNLLLNQRKLIKEQRHSLNILENKLRGM